jgi:photosystem II stability/assembly factor-like uncharacterized protein
MQRKDTLVALLVTLALGAAVPATAGIDRFTPFGPMNGTFQSLVVDPHSPATLLASAGLDGIFRSDDGGQTWAWSGAGAGIEIPQALAADPASSGVFYAIGFTQVLKSNDGGRHWTVVGTGQDFRAPFIFNSNNSLVFPKLAVLPAGPGLPPTLLVGAGVSLKRSADGGATWSQVYTAARPEIAWSLTFDPSDPRRVWAGLFSSQGGVLASTDAGQTWSRLTGLPDPFGLGAAAIVALPAAPGQPAALLASAGGSSSQEAVFKSTDNGETWREVPIATPPQLAVTALAYEPQTPAIVYAAATEALFVSLDAGETWHKRGAGLALVTIDDLVAAPGTRTVYALSGHDLEKSADRGRHWAPTAHSGYESLASPTLEIRSSPLDPSTVYVVLGGKAWKSSNRGATWASFADNLDPLVFLFVYDLVLDPAHPNLLYLATGNGIFRTLDGGATWSLWSQEQWHRLQLVGRQLALATGCGVARSTDGGRTWKRTLACGTTLPGDFEGRTVDRLLLAPHEPGVVYAGLVDVIGRHPAVPMPQIWKSADSGVTWKQIVADSEVLALDPNRPGRLYAARPGGIERSDNGGRTWRAVSSFGALDVHGNSDRHVVDLLVDPATPTTLYAATREDGIWRSLDSGATWEPLNAGIARFTVSPAYALAVNPAVPHLLYAGVGGFILQNQLTEP